jgi:hypothetical protein
MVISSSNVQMNSSRIYERNVTGQTTITKWQGFNPSSMSSTTRNFSSGYKEESFCSNYNDFARSLKNSQSSQSNALKSDSAESGAVSSVAGITHQSAIDSMREMTSKTFISLLELLYKSRGLTSRTKSDYNYYNSSLNFDYSSRPISDILSSQATVWNQVTDTSYSMYESEAVTFESNGTAITADGRELSFGVSFSMSRTFQEEYSSSDFMQYEQVLTDPLVINLDSNPVSVSDQTFYFDIDCDGVLDEISTLSSGNGFLALDKNGDGIINDGSELFGTRSGNGFSDLAAYDEDQNGWIDEADSIFNKLKVWTKDENGNDKLISLKDADIGAIYLGSSATGYSLKDSDNSTNAYIRSSGIYLKESGGSGVISQIDLAKH